MPITEPYVTSTERESHRSSYGQKIIPKDEGRKRFDVWHHVSFGILVLSLSFLVGSLFFLKNQFLGAWKTQFESFRWLVLVQGDQNQVDEIGGYLRKIPGVGSVTFVSSSDAFNRMKANGFFQQELKDLDAGYLPSSWEVRWGSDQTVDRTLLRGEFDEITRLPGVLDVAYDWVAWDSLQILKKYGIQIRVVLSLTYLFGIILGVLFMGRLLFFTAIRKIPWSYFIATTGHTFLWWLAGYLLVYHLLGPLSPHLLWGGVLAGLFHVFYKQQGRASSSLIR